VYGHLSTAQSLSPVVAPAVGSSLVAFIVVYFIVFGAGAFYILRLMARAPVGDKGDQDLANGPIRTAGITPGPAEGTPMGAGHGA